MGDMGYELLSSADRALGFIILVTGMRAAWLCIGLVVGRFGLCIESGGDAKGFGEGFGWLFRYHILIIRDSVH